MFGLIYTMNSWQLNEDTLPLALLTNVAARVTQLERLVANLSNALDELISDLDSESTSTEETTDSNKGM